MKSSFLTLLLVSIFLISCKKDNDEAPLSDKKVRMEINFTGSYQNYVLFFGAHNFSSSSNLFVEPKIISPAIAWTEIVGVTKGAHLETPINFNKLIIESSEPVNTAGFIINTALTSGYDDPGFENLKCIIKVYANGVEYGTFNFTAPPPGQAVAPYSELIQIK